MRDATPRLVRDYPSESERVRQNLTIAEAQLRDSGRASFPASSSSVTEHPRVCCLLRRARGGSGRNQCACAGVPLIPQLTRHPSVEQDEQRRDRTELKWTSCQVEALGATPVSK